MWHLPLQKQLQAAFQGAEFARLSRYHQSNDRPRPPPGRGSDLCDFSFYKDFNEKYGWVDPRWLLLAASVDGFNPFNKLKVNYSVWPCFVKVLNLPPHLRNRPEFMFLVFVTQGPKAPKSLAPYLDLLVDDLLQMWEEGFAAYDGLLQENFLCKAALAFLICDEPGSAEARCVRGHQAKEGCSYCHHRALRIAELDKIVFSGSARFLPDGHRPLGTMERPHDKTHRYIVEGQTKWLEGKQGGMNPTALGRICDEYGVCGYTPLNRLPYFDLVRHSISDTMHWLENAGSQLINILKGVRATSEKEVQYELDCGNMPADWDANQPLPWVVPKDKHKIVEERLNSVLRAPNLSLNPINIWLHPGFIKAQGWLVFFRFLALYVFDGLLHPRMQEAFTLYVQAVHLVLEPTQPTNSRELDKLQEQVAKAVWAMECALPTYEHTLMLVHFPLHIVRCIVLFGPCHVHWMFAFERLMSVLKRWCKQRGAPEASIVMQYSRNRSAWYGVAARLQSVRRLFKHLEAFEDDGGAGSFDYEPRWMDQGSSQIRGGSARSFAVTEPIMGHQLRTCYSGFHDIWEGLMKKFDSAKKVYAMGQPRGAPAFLFAVWLMADSTVLTAEEKTVVEGWGKRYHVHQSLQCNGRVVRPYPEGNVLMDHGVYSFMVKTPFEENTYYGRVIKIIEHDMMGSSTEDLNEPTNHLFCQVKWYDLPTCDRDRRNSPYVDMRRTVDRDRPWIVAEQVFMVPVAISGHRAYILENE